MQRSEICFHHWQINPQSLCHWQIGLIRIFQRLCYICPATLVHFSHIFFIQIEKLIFMTNFLYMHQCNFKLILSCLAGTPNIIEFWPLMENSDQNLPSPLQSQSNALGLCLLIFL